jgi:hypothetical protein
MSEEIKHVQVEPYTAILAFAGWLTSRDEVTGPFSARHDAGQMARLTGMFCDAQGWKVDDAVYSEQIKLLKENYPDSSTLDMKGTNSMSDTTIEQAIKNQRVDIDRCIKSGKILLESVNRGTGGRELALSFTKLQEAKMWLGKALEELGTLLPEEYRDEAK